LRRAKSSRKLAIGHVHELPRTIRTLLYTIGALKKSGSNLVSYLLFEEGYCRALIKLGYDDAMKRRDDLMPFSATRPAGCNAAVSGWTPGPRRLMKPYSERASATASPYSRYCGTCSPVAAACSKSAAGPASTQRILPNICRICPGRPATSQTRTPAYAPGSTPAQLKNLPAAAGAGRCRQRLARSAIRRSIQRQYSCTSMSWPHVESMFAGIAAVLAPGGVLALYGPFNYGGRYTSDSNARFDDWLKARDAASGIRDFENVDALARSHGCALLHDFAMPANNRMLIWRD
jgi:hypothetical protein